MAAPTGFESTTLRLRAEDANTTPYLLLLHVLPRSHVLYMLYVFALRASSRVNVYSLRYTVSCSKLKFHRKYHTTYYTFVAATPGGKLAALHICNVGRQRGAQKKRFLLVLELTSRFLRCSPVLKVAQP